MAIYLVGDITGGVRPLAGGAGPWPHLTCRESRKVLRMNQALSGEEIARIISGPSVRCLETVAQLARDRGLRVQIQPELGEIASVYRALGCLVVMREDRVLACMPTALLHAVVDFLLLADVRVEQLGDLVWVKRIEDSLVGPEEVASRKRDRSKEVARAVQS